MAKRRPCELDSHQAIVHLPSSTIFIRVGSAISLSSTCSGRRRALELWSSKDWDSGGARTGAPTLTRSTLGLGPSFGKSLPPRRRFRTVRPSPSVRLVRSAFEAAGLHPKVGFLVREVEWAGRVLCIGAELHYSAASPICCADPGCYVTALRPHGLASIADTIRREELFDETPGLRVNVALVLESGFSFTQKHLGAAYGTTVVYEHPEDK
jgi:hypothetical protein